MSNILRNHHMLNFIDKAREEKLTGNAIENRLDNSKSPNQSEAETFTRNLFFNVTNENRQHVENEYSIAAITYLVSKYPDAFFANNTTADDHMLNIAARAGAADLSCKLADVFIKSVNFKTIKPELFANILCNIMTLMQHKKVQNDPETLDKLKTTFKTLYNKYIENNEDSYFTHTPVVNGKFLYAYNRLTAYAMHHDCHHALIILLENKSNKFIEQQIKTAEAYKLDKIFVDRYLYYNEKQTARDYVYGSHSSPSYYNKLFKKAMEKSENNPHYFLDTYFSDQFNKNILSENVSLAIEAVKSTNTFISTLITDLENNNINITAIAADLTEIADFNNYQQHPDYKLLITTLNDSLTPIIREDGNVGIDNIHQLYKSIINLKNLDSSELIKIHFKILKPLVAMMEKESIADVKMNACRVILKGLDSLTSQIASLKTNNSTMKNHAYKKCMEYLHTILRSVNYNDEFSLEDYQNLFSLHETLKLVKNLDLKQLATVANTAEEKIKEQQEAIERLNEKANSLSKVIKESLSFDIDNISIADNIQNTLISTISKKLSSIQDLLTENAIQDLTDQHKITIFDFVKESLIGLVAQLLPTMLSETDLENFHTQLLNTKLRALFITLKSKLSIENDSSLAIVRRESLKTIKDKITQEQSELNQAMWTSITELTTKYSPKYLKSIGENSNDSISIRLSRLQFYIDSVTECTEHKIHPAYPLFQQALKTATKSLATVISSGENNNLNLDDNTIDELLAFFERINGLKIEIATQLNLMKITVACINTLDDNILKLEKFTKLLSVSEFIELTAGKSLPNYHEQVQTILTEIANIPNDNLLSYEQSTILMGSFNIVNIDKGEKSLSNLKKQCETNINNTEEAKKQTIEEINNLKSNSSLLALTNGYHNICNNIMTNNLLKDDGDFLSAIYRQIIFKVGPIIEDREQIKVGDLETGNIKSLKNKLTEIGKTLNIPSITVKASVDAIQPADTKTNQQQHTSTFLGRITKAFITITTLTPKVPTVNIEDTTPELDDVANNVL